MLIIRYNDLLFSTCNTSIDEVSNGQTNVDLCVKIVNEQLDEVKCLRV
jgi:hypothetical protein